MSEEHRHDHHHTPPRDDEARATYCQLLATAMRELLIEKGIVSADELRQAMERMDARSPMAGARVVAHAWRDSAFKQRLLNDAPAACRELDIDIGPTRLVAVENTASVHNVIVCTLCSCYPRMLLGLPPAWYKSREYRARVVREPRAVLREFGTELPDSTAVRVHDSTADLRYLVLPARPAGTDAMEEEQLIDLVSRDSMIGVTVPQAPS